MLVKHTEVTQPWKGFRDKQLWNLEVNDLFAHNLDGLQRVYKHWGTRAGGKMSYTDALRFASCGTHAAPAASDLGGKSAAGKDRLKGPSSMGATHFSKFQRSGQGHLKVDELGALDNEEER